ncbi:MAG: hypothetical protein JXA82_04240 [Sedimentisphaerales bacterium]|nr:hypothetical protein [Sedimentisphaerales bacterium]
MIEIDSSLHKMQTIVDVLIILQPRHDPQYFYKANAPEEKPWFEEKSSISPEDLLKQSQQPGWQPVQRKTCDIRLKLARKYNEIQAARIAGRRLTDILMFDNISLWQFVPAACYFSAPSIRQTLEWIEYGTELINRYRPGSLRVVGMLQDYHLRILEQMRRLYQIPIVARSVPHASPSTSSPTSSEPTDPLLQRVEKGHSFAVAAYAQTIRKPFSVFSPNRDRAILMSVPNAWTSGKNGQDKIDQYFHIFKDFLSQYNLQGIRLEPPNYFNIPGSKKEYIDWALSAPQGGYSTLFWDEFYDPAFFHTAQQWGPELLKRFEYLSTHPDFLSAFDWNRINGFTVLKSFWQETFVTHLVDTCIPALLTARNMLAQVRPKVILVACEASVFARAVTIEARRAGISTIALQHGTIHPEHDYYLHDEMSDIPDLTKPFSGFVTPRSTLVYGDFFANVLTQIGCYPARAVCSLGCDWRIFNQTGSESYGKKAEELRSCWFRLDKKVALLATRPFMEQKIIEKIAQKLNPQTHVLLIKLHPGDQDEDLYRRIFTRYGFEIRIERNHLYEAIRMSDLVISSIYTTVIADCLAQGKRVYRFRQYDMGYTLPWTEHTIDLDTVDRLEGGSISGDERAKLDKFLRSIGHNPDMTLNDIYAKLHSLFARLGLIPSQQVEELPLTRQKHPYTSQPARW